MPKSIVSRTQTVYSTEEFDMQFHDEIEPDIVNIQNEIDQEQIDQNLDHCPIFDFKKYMYSIHYRLERKLIGTK